MIVRGLRELGCVCGVFKSKCVCARVLAPCLKFFVAKHMFPKTLHNKYVFPKTLHNKLFQNSVTELVFESLGLPYAA